jgi:hypothetical protein
MTKRLGYGTDASCGKAYSAQRKLQHGQSELLALEQVRLCKIYGAARLRDIFSSACVARQAEAEMWGVNSDGLRHAVKRLRASNRELNLVSPFLYEI